MQRSKPHGKLHVMSTRFIVLLIAATLPPSAAHAAALDGASLSWPWVLPFAGILATIAVGPLLFPRLWHRHYGKFVFVWAALTLAPMAALRGVDVACAGLAHALVGDYLGFIALLFALYVVAGGILLTGTLRGTPLVNALVILFGTLIASVIGTTGAAMILIRPLLRANAARLHNVHVVVFFIFLVGNIGGALSPLGENPARQILLQQTGRKRIPVRQTNLPAGIRSYRCDQTEKAASGESHLAAVFDHR